MSIQNAGMRSRMRISNASGRRRFTATDSTHGLSRSPCSTSAMLTVRLLTPDCRFAALSTSSREKCTLDGKVKLKIKPETQNGTKVRLKGKGFPVYKKEGQFGDLIVTYSVKIPTNLTEAQKELFRQLQSMN